MVLEAAVVVPILNKLLSLGLSTWKAREDHDLNADDVKGVQALLDAGGAVGALVRKDPSAAPIAVRHFTLVTRAFGEAFRRHWYGDPHLAPQGGMWARFKESEVGKQRRAQLERRTTLAASKLLAVGDRPAEEDLAIVSALVGEPMNTPYYRRLWEAYTDASHAEPGEEPLIMPGEGYRQFERHFRLAYAEGLAAPPGEAIRRYLMGLEGDRIELVRALAIRDMAGWGRRHVFGPAGEQSELPPMPLGTMYVEPNATLQKKGEAVEIRPVLDFVRQLLQEHPVVAVKAHFGHGKSLSARMLAWRWAEARIAESAPAPDLWLPIVVKCAEDFTSHNDDLDQVVRRALWRQAAALGLGLSSDDAAFALPPPGWRTVVLIDGLDEVTFGSRDLEALFRRMRERANDRRRFVVFSRPAVLPSAEHLKDIPVIELQSFTTDDGFGKPGGQVAGWIERWNRVTGQAAPITAEGLAERKLLEIASTPILLLMIASTWKQIAAATSPPTLAVIYEEFFAQIARGKYKADVHGHPLIVKAAKRLCRALIDGGDLPEAAEPPESMLWFLSRLAWQAKRLEDGQWFGKGKKSLREFDVRKILRDELEIDDSPKIEQTVYMGVLLALQADLIEGKSRILFGHKSFREFLIARYWEQRLRKVIQSEGDERDAAEESLLGGRLLEVDDQSFKFLCEMLGDWRPEDRLRLFRWAEGCFNDERPQRGAKSFRDDLRPLLRESALAIGSSLAEESGVKAKDPRTLRSMLAWFWLQPISISMVIAPRLVSEEANLQVANLSRANLSRANLQMANLSGANLQAVNLSASDLSGAYLGAASLGAANLSRAYMRMANLRMADLSGADLRKADLRGSNLSGADLRGANLHGADLRMADLRGAYLGGAQLSGTDLDQALALEEDRDAFTKVGVVPAMLDKIQWVDPEGEPVSPGDLAGDGTRE